MTKIVVALGGNMLITKGDEATYEMQVAKSEQTAKVVVDLYQMGHEVVVTHGNGPQVGNLLLQQTSSSGVPALPLRILTAMTQTQIGVMLQHAILNEFRQRGLQKEVCVIPTSVDVELTQEEVKNPSKPVGPFYSKEEFEQIWKPNEHFKHFEGKGYRKLVPSPRPKKIMEAGVIEDLSNKGTMVIAVGGGGTPVVHEGGKTVPIDGVIDKDRASAVLADQMRADMLIILTNVEGAYTDFGKPAQKKLTRLNNADAETLLAEGIFGRGTMEPKIEACVQFTKEPNRTALITDPEHLSEALSGNAGTTIYS